MPNDELQMPEAGDGKRRPYGVGQIWGGERVEVLDMVRLVEAGQACLEQLDADERLVLEILTDEGGGKLVKISEVLDVSLTTAYRKKCRVLQRISELFEEYQVKVL